MWLCDLEKAIKDIRTFFPDGCVFDKIEPIWTSICFYLSDYSVIWWHENGEKIIRKLQDGTEIILRNFSKTY